MTNIDITETDNAIVLTVTTDKGSKSATIVNESKTSVESRKDEIVEANNLIEKANS